MERSGLKVSWLQVVTGASTEFSQHAAGRQLSASTGHSVLEPAAQSASDGFELPPAADAYVGAAVSGLAGAIAARPASVAAGPADWLHSQELEEALAELSDLEACGFQVRRPARRGPHRLC